MNIKDDMIFKKSEDAIERTGSEELLIFHSTVGKLFEVNSVGKNIWQLLDGKRTVEEIKEILGKEYGNVAEINKDLSEFLNKLLKLNIIKN